MKQKYSKMAIASFVLGVLFFLLIPTRFVMLLFVLAFLPIVFGFTSLSEIKKDKRLKGRILALMGAILGIVEFIASILLSQQYIFHGGLF